MSIKFFERREQKIEEATKNNNWDEVSRLLQQEQNNAERRDRYHHFLKWLEALVLLLFFCRLVAIIYNLKVVI